MNACDVCDGYTVLLKHYACELTTTDAVMGWHRQPLFVGRSLRPDAEGSQIRLTAAGNQTRPTLPASQHQRPRTSSTFPRPRNTNHLELPIKLASLSLYPLHTSAHNGCCTHPRAEARPQVRPLRLSYRCSYRSERTPWTHNA
jgi:hypothetical protein